MAELTQQEATAGFFADFKNDRSGAFSGPRPLAGLTVDVCVSGRGLVNLTLFIFI